MRKFFFTIFAVFILTPESINAKPVEADISVYCPYPGSVECKLNNPDSRAVISITNCDDLENYKTPGKGKALFVKMPQPADDADNTKSKKCSKLIGSIRQNCSDTRTIYLIDKPEQENADYLISCNEQTHYTITYGSANDLNKPRNRNLGASYAEQMCDSTNGKFSNGRCTKCKYQDDFIIDGECFCKYGDGYISPKLSDNCPDSWYHACTLTGGKNKKDTPTEKCVCPDSKNLMHHKDSYHNYCVCKPGYIFKDPYDRRLGCVEEGTKNAITITVTDNSNQGLADIIVSYKNESEKLVTKRTGSNGTVMLSDVPNNAWLNFSKSGYYPALYSLDELQSKGNKIVLQVKASTDFQACLPQTKSTGRTGILVDSTKYVYCGNKNERDCRQNDIVKSNDDIFYKCDNNSWKQINKSTVQECDDGIKKDKNAKYYLNNDNSALFLRSYQKRELSDGKSYQSSSIGWLCQIKNLSDFCISKKSFLFSPNACEAMTSTNNVKKTSKPQTEEQQTEELQTQEPQTQELQTQEQQTEEPQTQEPQTQEPQTQELQTQEQETEEPQTQEPQLKNIDNITAKTDTPNNNVDATAEVAKQRLAQAKSALKDIKDHEQSGANRALTAASTGITGVGGMLTASAISEQKADKEAEEDMRGYLETFQCEYGKGTIVKPSEGEVTLPGGNELMEYYTEYKQLADRLKTTKTALGLRKGIESETLYDKAQTELYQYANVGKTGGTYTSLSRALTDPESADAADWAEQKKDSKNKLTAGIVIAGVGVVGGAVGNYLINRDYTAPEIKTDFETIATDLQNNYPEIFITPEGTEEIEEIEEQDKPDEIDETITPEPNPQPDKPEAPVATLVDPQLMNIEAVSDKTFKKGELTLSDDGEKALGNFVEKIIEELKKPEYSKAQLKVDVEAHTDKLGLTPATKKKLNVKNNEELSQKRANTIMDFLMEQFALDTSIKDRVKKGDAIGKGYQECKEAGDQPACRKLIIKVTDIYNYNNE